MGSVNAENVAIEVVKSLGKSRKISLGKIIRKNGYSNRTSLTPKNVTETKSYKKITEPVLEQLKKERERAIKRLSKTISKAKYRDLIDGIDKFTKNIQLLEGKPTDRTDNIFNEEQICAILSRRSEKDSSTR